MRYEEPPTVEAPAFRCARCGAYAQQTWHLASISATNAFGNFGQPVTDEPFDPEDFEPRNEDYQPWRISVCGACQRPSLWVDQDLAFPISAVQGLEPHNDLPADAKKLLTEGISCLPHSRRASAALSRAALESFLRDYLGNDAKDLQLQGMVSKLSGTVTPALWQLLTVLRHVGNRSLHHNGNQDGAVALYLDETDASVAHALIETLNRLTEELVTYPKKASDLYRALPEEVQRNAEKFVKPSETKG